jgi:acetyltransferase-like isoleucine patch superfamily enzyme
MKDWINKFKMALLKQRVVLINFFYKRNITLIVGSNTTFGCNLDIRLGKNSVLIIEDQCIVGDGCLLECADNAAIRLGRKVLLFKDVVISARESIEIKQNTLIGEFSSIIDSDRSFNNIDIPIIEQGYLSKPICIDEDVWIGRGVAILKGVTIGRHSVIGANSVVTKNIPETVVAGGIPAKVIKDLKS